MRPNDPSSTTTPTATPEGSSADRLDSWKEIAAFLQRDIRTVQRWEKQAGLPVHRHAEARLRTAFAYRSELDAWWRMQATAVTGELPDETPAPAKAWWRRRAVAIPAGVALLATLAVLGGLAVWRHRPVTVAPPPHGVAVLLTRLEDRAGQSSLATAIEEVLAREFAGHAGIEPVAPSRVRRTLRLMRLSADTSLTSSIGRELAIRDGRIPFVIAGKLHQLGSRYFVDLEAIRPADGRVQVSVERQADDPAALLAYVADESRRLADALLTASATAGAPTEALEPATTASLPALRLYSAAVQAGNRRQWRASQLLAERAIESDPQLAVAHTWVAWAMRQQGAPASACLPASTRARELSAGLTDRETYFIAAIHDLISGSVPATIAALEALLRLHPGDRLALDILIAAYSRAGRVKDAVDLSVLRAESDPGGFYANVRAAHALTIWHTNAKQVTQYVERAQRLASRSVDEDRPTWDAWLAGLPVFHHWLEGQSREGLDVLARLQQGLNGRLGRERDAYATIVGFSYLAFGQVQESSRAFRLAVSPVRQLNLATQALALGDAAQARQWLMQIREHASTRPALFAAVGLEQDADRGLASAPPSDYAEGMAEVTRGLIAARRGQSEVAIASLRRGVELLRFSGELEYFLATEALARIWVVRGEQDRALNLLKDAADQRVRTYGSAQWTGAYWMKLNHDLAAQYRHLGLADDADRTEAVLRRLLTHADGGHPFGSPIAAVVPAR